MTDPTGTQPCADCVTGHMHQGTPAGHEEERHGLNLYVAGPESDKILIIFTDIFGYTINNIRLIADHIAKESGQEVLIPDFFKGDALPLSLDETLMPDPKAPPKPFFTRAKNMFSAVGSAAPWFLRHREGVSRPVIEAFLTAVRAAQPQAKVSGMGYCWGGRYALLGTHTFKETGRPLLDCAVLVHPSMTSDAEYAQAQSPLSLQIGDNDMAMSMSKVESARAIIDKNKMGQTIIYPGQKHGFAARGSQSEPETVKAQNKCNADAIAFFKANL